MNKFEKKALAKRAYRALIKRAWSISDLWGGNKNKSATPTPKVPEAPPEAPQQFAPITLSTVFDESEPDIPDLITTRELLYNGADPSTEGYTTVDGDWWEPDYPDTNAPKGLLTALGANTETRERDGRLVSSAYNLPLPKGYSRPYGPLLDGQTASLMAKQIMDRAWKAEPGNGKNIIGNPWLEQMRLNYYPRLQYELSRIKAMNELPQSIKLSDKPDKPTPYKPEIIPDPVYPSPQSSGTEWPLSTRHQRSPRVQARKAPGAQPQKSTMGGSTLGNRAGRAPGY